MQLAVERAVRVQLSGRVQGVGFRSFLAREADRLAIAGWVRNRHDGTVEAVFIGSPENVDAMIAAAREGPAPAKVADVAVADYVGPALTRFTELPTE